MNTTETRHWINCPNCDGPQQVHQACGYTRDYKGQQGYLFGCKGCNQFVVIQRGQFRQITSKVHVTGTECRGVCINGKHSCDCKCRGRCHGAGTCYCVKVVAA